MIGWLLRILVTIIGATSRWRMEDPLGVFTNPPPQRMIFAFWHNQIFLMPCVLCNRWNIHGRTKFAVLVSASNDGGKLVRVLEKFDIACVRGSSSRRGREALRELTRLVKDGYDIGITPDGPRGPKYQVADGVTSLAQLTGCPIVPVAYRLSWKITLKSWDAFMIPLPFGRVTFRVAPPITVPREADSQERENKRLELETVLKTLSES